MVVRALPWASLTSARSLSVEVPLLLLLAVLLCKGQTYASLGSSDSSGGWPSFCLRQFFREDTTSPTNSSRRSGPQGADPGSLLSLYTW